MSIMQQVKGLGVKDWTLLFFGVVIIALVIALLVKKDKQVTFGMRPIDEKLYKEQLKITEELKRQRDYRDSFLVLNREFQGLEATINAMKQDLDKGLSNIKKLKNEFKQNKSNYADSSATTITDRLKDIGKRGK